MASKTLAVSHNSTWKFEKYSFIVFLNTMDIVPTLGKQYNHKNNFLQPLREIKIANEMM